jgi:hypothetical protein
LCNEPRQPFRNEGKPRGILVCSPHPRSPHTALRFPHRCISASSAPQTPLNPSGSARRLIIPFTQALGALFGVAQIPSDAESPCRKTLVSFPSCFASQRMRARRGRALSKQVLAHGREGCLRDGENGAHEGDRKAADCVVGYAFVYVVGLE